MPLFGLAIAYLRRRWGQALLSVLVGALGIAAVATAAIGIESLPEAAERAWGGVDLVIGPKGSALDLVLCCALHLSDPQGLVSEKLAMEAAQHPLIRAAAPLALGDSVDGWRIVGTTPAILSIYRATLSSGNVWTAPLEAVLGSRAAQALGLKPGDTFVGAHGLVAGGEVHSEFPYKVVGVLAPTGSALDRLVLSDIETVRVIHREHEKEEATDASTEDRVGNIPNAATAVIASYRSPVAAVLVPRLINASPALSAASPSFEIARLMGYFRPVTTAVTGLGLLLVGIAAAGAAAGLMAAMNARTRDLALLRALGARPATLASVAFAEAGMLALGALTLGAGLTAILMIFAEHLLANRSGLLLVAHLDFERTAYIVAGAISVAFIAAAFPALRASRASIEELLQ